MPGRREQAPRFARRNCKLCAHSASIVAALGRQCAAAARTAGIQTQSPKAKQRRLPLEATHPTGVGQQTRPVPMRRRDYGPRNRGTQPHYPHDNSTNIPQCRGPARPFAVYTLENQRAPAWDRKVQAHVPFQSGIYAWCVSRGLREVPAVRKRRLAGW